MDISKLSPEERADLKAQLDAEERAEQERKEAEKLTYAELRNQTVMEVFEDLKKASEMIQTAKERALEKFVTVIKLKNELFGIKDGQRSHTWLSADGNIRIITGTNAVDRWDDIARTGKQKVFEWLNKNTTSENASFAEIIRELMQSNKDGDLDPRNVLTLQNHAQKSKDQELIDAVALIREGHRLDHSSTYVKVEIKDEHKKFRPLPLSISQA